MGADGREFLKLYVGVLFVQLGANGLFFENIGQPCGKKKTTGEIWSGVKHKC
jgi:hypothetical protein